MNAAVIDIGSGSVRLLLGGKKTTIMTKLGEGLGSSGTLRGDAIDRTVSTICDFVGAARLAGAEIHAFATEAVRAASNRAEFIGRVREKCGVDVEVISGCEEAEIALLGAAPSGDATVVDIGSASVEIVSGNAGKLAFVRSLPLGMVRLTEQADGSPDMIRAYAVSGLAKYGDVPMNGELIGVGGTFTSLAAMKLGLTAYDPAAVQDCVLTAEDAAELGSKLIEAGSPARIRELYPVLPAVRSELITAGAIFVQELLGYLGAPSIKVSESDNLDGYVRYKRLS